MRAHPSCAAALSSPESFAIAMLAVLDDRYDTDHLEWTPETLRAYVLDDYGVRMPNPNLDRVMAGNLIRTTDLFYNKIRNFIDVCNVLSGDTFDPWTFDPADLDEVAWGITEAHLISPPEPEGPPFSPVIVAYIRERADFEGIVLLPDVLAIAAPDGDPLSEFSDDPAMYGAIFQMQQGRSDELKDTIRTGLQGVLRQLSALKLEYGNTAGLLDKVKAIS